MSRKRPLHQPTVRCWVLLCVALAGVPAAHVTAAVVELTSVKDNTLIEFNYASYDPTDFGTYLYSNGKGPDISAGNTGGLHGIQRGLLQFNLSTIPAGATITDVSLQLEVIDVPNRAFETNYFWLEAVEGLDQPWGEGTSSKPSSGQAAATDGDATWFHTQYQPGPPAEHGYLDNPADPLKDFRATPTGYWAADKQGYLGDGPVNQADYNPADAFGVGWGLSGYGPLTHSTSQMVPDVQAWVDGSKTNLGWIVVGEEWYDAINPKNNKPGASKRDFASHDHGNSDYWPTLTVTYSAGPPAPIPEPASFTVFLVLAAIASVCLQRRRRG